MQIVKTESGTEYIFQTDENGKQTFIRFGSGMITGEVIVHRNEIKVGNCLDFDFHKEGIYGQLQESVMTAQSSPIVEITGT